MLRRHLCNGSGRRWRRLGHRFRFGRRRCSSSRLPSLINSGTNLCLCMSMNQRLRLQLDLILNLLRRGFFAASRSIFPRAC